jgi:hypothetical protein
MYQEGIDLSSLIARMHCFLQVNFDAKFFFLIQSSLLLLLTPPEQDSEEWGSSRRRCNIHE